MMRFSALATKCLVIDTSDLKSSLRSILYAACSTISFAWYSSIVDSAIIHWMPCFSARSDPWENRLSDRSTIMSSAISACAIQRMQWASRAGPRRYWPRRWPCPRPPSIWSSWTRRSSMTISEWPVEPCIVSTSRTSFQPSCGQVDDERGVRGLLDLGLVLGAAHEDREARAAGAADEPLVAVDDPLVAVLVPVRADQRRVRARRPRARSSRSTNGRGPRRAAGGTSPSARRCPSAAACACCPRRAPGR